MVVRNCRRQRCQELRRKCVGTTCGRSLLHRHASCTQAATRYGLDSEQNSHVAGVATSPKKRFCLASSLCFLCAHEASYVWVSFCAHMYACDVTYSNKILGNEPVTTFPMIARACCIGTSKKQDGARQCRQHAHVREKRYSLACEHKKRIEITRQRPC